MSKTSGKADDRVITEPLEQTVQPSMIEQSLLLWRTRKELARLQRIGDIQAYQAMLAVVAPLLDEQDKAQKARERRS